MNTIKPEKANSTSIFQALMLFSFVSRVQCPEIDLAYKSYETTSARLFFFSGEINPGLELGIFISAFESGINIRNNWHLCGLFCKQTKRVEKPFLAVLDFSEVSMLLQSGEKKSMVKLKKSPRRSLLQV